MSRDHVDERRINREAAWRTDCKRLSWLADSPARTPLQYSSTIVIRVPRQVVWKGYCDRDRRRLRLSIRRRPWWCGQTWWVRYRSKLPGHERWMTELPQTRKWLTLWVVERSDVESCTTGSRSWLHSTVVDWRLFTWRCHRHKLIAGSLKSHHIRRWTEAVKSSVTAYTVYTYTAGRTWTSPNVPSVTLSLQSGTTYLNQSSQIWPSALEHSSCV